MAMRSLAYIYSGNGQLKKFLFLVITAILNGGWSCRTQYLKRDYPRTIPARFGLIWFSGFRAKDLNVILYQNMPNLHNRYKSAERKNFLLSIAALV
jgi:hypothetical protein